MRHVTPEQRSQCCFDTVAICLESICDLIVFRKRVSGMCNWFWTSVTTRLNRPCILSASWLPKRSQVHSISSKNLRSSCWLFLFHYSGWFSRSVALSCLKDVSKSVFPVKFKPVKFKAAHSTVFSMLQAALLRGLSVGTTLVQSELEYFRSLAYNKLCLMQYFYDTTNNMYDAPVQWLREMCKA